ncbi:MAG: fibronectin type III domain-containing protein [Flavobacteriales bacterium]
MIRHVLLLMGFLLVHVLQAQTVSRSAAVQLSATVQNGPPSITLTWATHPNTTGFTIYRKLRSATSWGSAIATAPGSATSYTDNSVSAGTAYEYRVVRSASSGTGNGYISTGVDVPMEDFRGKIVLLVDQELAGPLTNELQQLTQDLRADGWSVLRSDVSRTASVASVRNVVIGHYNSDPANVKALYIIGHVPVPYSGNIAPDGHGEHQGAWPCDGYYGELNGTWTDNSVNANGAQRTENRNIPGDGKFDQSSFPSPLELQVGRVDMFDMPAFGQSEVELMRSYLNKVRQYKLRAWSPQVRGIVFDNLQWVNNPLAGSGWRNIAPLVGHANITEAYPYGSPFHTYVNGQSYLWTYASGGGSQWYEGSVLTYNGANNVATTQDYAGPVSMGGVFNMSFGSYFGDWDNKNNFLRAPLASGQALTNCWAAIPVWYFHHMGMGETIGSSTLTSMNNTSLYVPLTEGWQGSMGKTHLGLMGDPTLRMYMVAPPTNLAVANNNGIASFSWTASTEPVDGYHVYQIDPATQQPQRLTSSPVTNANYLNPAIPFIAGREYMVRAVKVQVSHSGRYQNLSLGAMATASGTAAPDCQGVVGGPSVPGTACNDGNACTTNDTWNANCQCVGTPSPDSDGDGICNAQDNCPNVAGQIGSSCNDGDPCTTNDVLNANCQCVGTPSPDSDGDGICNAQDNCPNVAGQIGSSCNDGDPCTTNDVLNANCQCVGTPSPDSDGDGICNAQDNCPNVAGQIGSSCNDGDPCTTNDVLNANCQCVGTPSPDSDGDGICNAQDNCPNVAGQIGSSCNVMGLPTNECERELPVRWNAEPTAMDGIARAETARTCRRRMCNDGVRRRTMLRDCQCVEREPRNGDGICNAGHRTCRSRLAQR